MTKMVNRLSVKAERKGAVDVGGDVLEIANFVAAHIGLRPNYKDRLDEFRFCNGRIDEAMSEFAGQ